MRKRIGIVSEGPTDYIMLKSIIDFVTCTENDYVRLQPEQDMAGRYGNGWKGVWKWCLDNGKILKTLIEGIEPKIDFIVIQMDGDVSRKEKEVHCACEVRDCNQGSSIMPLDCAKIKKNECPVIMPCDEHENNPEGYRTHLKHMVSTWMNSENNAIDDNYVITIPCDSTDAWIVAGYDKFENTESLIDPWEDIIACGKHYHGIRIPGHKKNMLVYQALVCGMESSWNDVIDLCQSAAELKADIQLKFGLTS